MMFIDFAGCDVCADAARVPAKPAAASPAA
jgi:hypothetical protein